MTIENWLALIVALQVVGLILAFERRAERRRFQVDLDRFLPRRGHRVPPAETMSVEGMNEHVG